MDASRRTLLTGGALAAGGIAMLAKASPAQALCSVATNIINVANCQSIAQAFDLARAADPADRSYVYFPAGRYTISSTILGDHPTEGQIAGIFGDGLCSIIEWAVNGDLVRFNEGAVRVLFRDFAIEAQFPQSQTHHAAFHFGRGAGEGAYFSNLRIKAEGGSGIRFLGVSNDVTIEHCYFRDIRGIGIEVRGVQDGEKSSEIRIIGGRIIATPRYGIGVYLGGGVGGMHIIGTDITQCYWGVLTESAFPNTQNRELFLTQATLDACEVGLGINDNIFASMTGCWTASCFRDNIWVNANLGNPMLVVSGGRIYNGQAGCNGITVNSGSFILNGVQVSNNTGVGVWVPNSAVSNYVISGCQITQNAGGPVVLNGANHAFSGNIVA